MKRCVFLRGNSASGKTSLAKTLQANLQGQTLLISQDVIRRDMLSAKDGIHTPALPLLENLLRYGYEHCETVIVEGILRSDWYQDLFELARGLYTSHLHAYYFELPFEETLARHQTRDKRQEFGKEKLRSWWLEGDKVEMLQEKSFFRHQSLDDCLQIILADVNQ